MGQRGWERIIIGSILGVCIAYYLIVDPEPAHKETAQQPPSHESEQAKARKALAHINPTDTPGVAWLEFFNGNNVVIGWNDRAGNPDWGLINRNAAIYGNKALGRGFHVWSVDGAERGWRPGSGSYLCETTARSGKVQDSSCP